MRLLAKAGSLVVTVALTGPIAISGEESTRLKEGPGRDLTAARCAICHSVDYIPMNAPVMNRAGWEKSVRKMIDVFGAPITEDEAKQIVAYLESYGS
jgi:cytochrome c5